MTTPEIQAKRNIALTVFYAAITLISAGSIIIDNGEALLNWRTALKEDLAVFICILALFYFTPQILDNKPQFIINNEGIWFREKNSPASKLCLLPWSKIMYFYVVRRKWVMSTSVFLKVGVKDTEEIAFNIHDFDVRDDRIVEAIKWYSQVHHFIDYGEEKSGF